MNPSPTFLETSSSCTEYRNFLANRICIYLDFNLIACFYNLYDNNAYVPNVFVVFFPPLF